MTMSINMHDRKRAISTFRGKDGSFVSLTIREEEDRNEIALFFNDEDDLLDFASRVTQAATWLANDPAREKKDAIRDERSQREMTERLNQKKVRRFAKALGLIPGNVYSDDPMYQIITGYVLFDPSDIESPVAEGSDFNTLRDDYNRKFGRKAASR